MACACGGFGSFWLVRRGAFYSIGLTHQYFHITEGNVEVLIHVDVSGFKPKTPMEERLAKMCVLPLLLAGVLSSPNMGTEELAVYLRELILQSSLNSGAWSPTKNSELIDSVRFLWYAIPVIMFLISWERNKSLSLGCIFIAGSFGEWCHVHDAF